MTLGLWLLLGSSISSNAQQVSWTRINWASANIGGQRVEHAALLVPVRLDGAASPAVMQLDTGADASVLYGVPYHPRSSADPCATQRECTLSGEFGATRFENVQFRVDPKFGASPPPGEVAHLGTIGAQFFEHRVLLLDFVAGRIVILTRNHKMFVALTLNGAEVRELFFDTGSSAMALMTTRGRWLEWTGRQPGDPQNRKFIASSWGKRVRAIGAPIKGAMCIGHS